MGTDDAIKVVATRSFNAPAADVWKAWSEPDYVKRWWGPNGFTAPVADLDFREGGTSLVCMSHPDYGDMYNTWQYTRIDPFHGIEFIQRFADEHGHSLDPQAQGVPPGVPPQVRHVVSFRTINGNGGTRTEMTVAEYGYTTAEAAQISEAGLIQCLDKMVAIFQ
jgi:uncharacterized protein YndB with AHSA1/START domain